MRGQGRLLWVMTALELLAGFSLLLVPGIALDALLGNGAAPAAETLAVSRLAGVALIAIGVMAHSGSHGGPNWWLLAGLLVYNAGAAAVLSFIGAGLGLAGPLLWPAAILHAGLTFWTLISLRYLASP
ncbi:MAG: hypothetical protein JNM20_10380 [Rhizobiales bacterium]|nr:hypothetical protein [Hyphomicrobiales bacterium]